MAFLSLSSFSFLFVSSSFTVSDLTAFVDLANVESFFFFLLFFKAVYYSYVICHVGACYG